MELAALVLSIISIVVSLAVPITLEVVRKPKLALLIGEAVGDERGFRILHLRVINRPLPRVLRKIISRRPAYQCYVDLDFRSMGSNSRKFEPIRAKWAKAPEPLILGEFDATKVPMAEQWDLAEGEEGESVAIAIKFAGEEHAYAFNSLSYQFEGLKNPRWLLSKNEYVIRARGVSGPVSVRQNFVISNLGTSLEQFRLRWPN